MFQLKSRVVSITTNTEEREVLNERITEWQEKKSVVYGSIKELFSALLSEVLSDENKEIQITEDEPEGENNVNTDENNVNFIPESEYYESEIQRLTSEKQLLLDKNSFLNDQIIVQNHKIQELEYNKEVLEVPIPFVFGSNDIYLKDLADWKIESLAQISKYRFQKGLEKEELSLSETADKLMFNRGNLFNWHGEFKTGLK